LLCTRPGVADDGRIEVELEPVERRAVAPIAEEDLIVVAAVRVVGDRLAGPIDSSCIKRHAYVLTR
jgi:hypothetical protein